MKRLLYLLGALLYLTASASAHSGRTDSQGGHRDNRNVSGLGSYHYHCGGYPAHLHKNGRCPYRSATTSSTSTVTSQTSTSTSAAPTHTSLTSPNR